MRAEVFLGAACKYGHDGRRYVLTKGCVECSNLKNEKNKEIRSLYYKDKRKENPQYRVDYRKEWALENRERVSKTNQKWYEQNKERKKQKQKIWNLNNKDRLKVHSQNRKSRIGVQKISYEDIQRKLMLQKESCAVCKTVLDSYEIDHVVPLALGGKHEASNIQILCPHCNRTKSKKDPLIFMQSKGYLL